MGRGLSQLQKDIMAEAVRNDGRITPHHAIHLTWKKGQSYAVCQASVSRALRRLVNRGLLTHGSIALNTFCAYEVAKPVEPRTPAQEKRIAELLAGLPPEWA